MTHVVVVVVQFRCVYSPMQLVVAMFAVVAVVVVVVMAVVVVVVVVLILCAS